MPTIDKLPRVSTGTNLENILIPVQETVGSVSVTKSLVAASLASGYIGSLAIVGPVGFTGSVGTQGPRGPVGPQGFVGSGGVSGPIGPSGGAQGPIGPSGGVQGPVGAAGPMGYTGSSGSGGGGPIGPISREIIFSIPTDLTTGTGINRWYIDTISTITNVLASVSVTPSGSSVIFDVNKNGTTIFTTQANRPTIPASGYYTFTNVANITTLAVGDYLSVDVDQIGSSVSGSSAIIRIKVI